MVSSGTCMTIIEQPKPSRTAPSWVGYQIRFIVSPRDHPVKLELAYMCFLLKKKVWLLPIPKSLCSPVAFSKPKCQRVFAKTRHVSKKAANFPAPIRNSAENGMNASCMISTYPSECVDNQCSSLEINEGRKHFYFSSRRIE